MSPTLRIMSPFRAGLNSSCEDTPRNSLDHVRELQNCRFISAGNVKHSTMEILLQRTDRGIDCVIDVNEISALIPIAKDRNRLVSNDLSGEDRNNSAVLARSLPRAVDVEVP